MSQIFTKSFYGKSLYVKTPKAVAHKKAIKTWYLNNPSACLTVRELLEILESSKSYTDRIVNELVDEKFLMLGEPDRKVKRSGPRSHTYMLKKRGSP